MTRCCAVPELPNEKRPGYEWLSPAKVNLSLRIVGTRPDGYHLLDSLVVPVDLCDRLSVSACRLARGEPSIIEVRSDCADVPGAPDNLAWRAARSVLAAAGIGARVYVEIEKRIPVCAGLGGGSSNAATVINALNGLLALRMTGETLSRIAVGVGADVPFFLGCLPARVRGIGEEITPVVLNDKPELVIAVPRARVRTAWAFGEFDRSLTRQGQTRSLTGSEDSGWRGASSLFNDLEEVVMRAHPEVREAKEALLAAGAVGAVMSGSGSAVVGVASSALAAREMAGRLADGACQAFAVSVIEQPLRGRLPGSQR